MLNELGELGRFNVVPSFNVYLERSLHRAGTFGTILTRGRIFYTSPSKCHVRIKTNFQDIFCCFEC